MKIKSIKNLIIYVYLIVMLGIFPLYMREGYSDIGDRKYNLFLLSSVFTFGLLLILTTISVIITKESTWTLNTGKAKLPELAVYSFFATVFISFLVSPYKEYAIIGAADWYMGMVTQVIFLVSFLYMSKELEYKEWILYMLYAVSAVVFFSGLLNRFGVDVFGVYEGLDNEIKLQFLSTIGQSSWYSGYLCTVLPIGLYDFYMSKGRRRILLGAYLAIAFSSLVTQNTDSAYIALAGMILVLLYKASVSKEGMCSFAQVMIVMFGSFWVVGILQTIFCHSAIIPEKLSVLMSQGLFTPLLCSFFVLVYFMLKKNILGDLPYNRFFYSGLVLAVLAVIVWIVMIVLNTTGRINPPIDSTYLTWNETWGNYRGIAWILAINLYKAIGTPWGYLFGVGADCFYVHSCCVPDMADYVDSVVSGIYYANAHNDYLTILVNYGIIGLATYLAMIVLAVKNFIKSNNTVVVGIAMSIVAYALHNVFCYQEVCNAPYFYIFMGLGINLLKNEEK